MYWNSDSSFPLSEHSWSAWRPPFGRRINGEQAVRRVTRRWHPNDPLLASTPDSERLLPPICIPQLAQALHHRTTNQWRLLLVMYALVTIGFGAFGIYEHSVYLLRGTAAFALTFCVFLVQYRLLFLRLERMRQYSRFCAWAYLQKQSTTAAFGTMMIAAATIQYFLQASEGGLFPLVERYGLEFIKAPDQPWRYLTGPFFHSGSPHWIANFIMLTIFAGLSSPIGRANSLWVVFLSGVFIPAFTLTFLPHWVRADAFLGISGGVFALLGWFTGVSYRNKSVFPYGLPTLTAGFGIAMILVSYLLDFRSSWYGHTFGLAIGIMAGLLSYGVKLDFNNPGPEN